MEQTNANGSNSDATAKDNVPELNIRIQSFHLPPPETRRANATESSWTKLKTKLGCLVHFLNDFVAKNPGTNLENCKKFKVMKEELDNYGDQQTDEQLSRLGAAIKLSYYMDLPPGTTEEDFAPFMKEATELEEEVTDAVVDVIVSKTMDGKGTFMSFRCLDE